MTETAYVKPREGLIVSRENPHEGDIPAEGAEVPLTSYYRRRLADGDLVKARKPKDAPPKDAPPEGGEKKGAK